MLRLSSARRALRRLSTAASPSSSSSTSPEALERAFLLGNYWPDGVRGQPGLAFESGSGCVLRASDGREYLDFFAGIAVNALGHSDPAVAEVLAAQARKVQHVSNLYHTWEPLRLAEQLVRTAPQFKKVFLCNSGTEANEGALKFAKKHALAAALRAAAGLPAGARPPPFTAFGCKSSAPTACFTQGGMCGCWPQAANNSVALGVKNEVLAFKNGFHGRSMGSLAATHKPAIRWQFAPFPADVRFARFNNLDGARARGAPFLQLHSTHTHTHTHTHSHFSHAPPPPPPPPPHPSVSPPPHTHTPDVHKLWTPKIGAVIVEPVQGEGGITPAAPGFLRALKDLCEARGALLIVDEVQCGLGRTGRLWAHEAHDVAPDMMTLAKPLAAGLPIGAVLLTDAVAASVWPGEHGTTYGGNPLVAAVAEHVLGRIAEPAFLAAVRARGEQLLAGMRALGARFPHAVVEVRSGGGLFVGVELAPGAPFKALQEAALARGLLIISCGDNVVRLCPPLVITEAEVAQGVRVIGEAMAEAFPKK